MTIIIESCKEKDLNDMIHLIFPKESILKNNENIHRWYQEGLHINFKKPFFGLRQAHGGPCGLLAAVQAEMIRNLMFKNDTNHIMDIENIILDSCKQKDLILDAIRSILERVKENINNQYIMVVPSFMKLNNNSNIYDKISIHSKSIDFLIYKISTKDELKIFLIDNLKYYMINIILFLFSIILTHGGCNKIREIEMDCKDSTLTGEFGYCNQELLNLLLTGQTTSNVFDGNVPISEESIGLNNENKDTMMLRGIMKRPVIGYLTHLEALRYCQVGSYYKTPILPIWVIGSSSHFTVLFGLDKNICKENKDEMIFSKLTRIFKSYDPNENGYINVTDLSTIINKLDLPHTVITNPSFSLDAIINKIKVAGLEIIVWEEFWQFFSILLKYNDIKRAFDFDMKSNRNERRICRTDSDLARQLQAQLDNGEDVDELIQFNDTIRNTQDSIVDEINTNEVNESNEFVLYHYNGLVKKNLEKVPNNDQATINNTNGNHNIETENVSLVKLTLKKDTYLSNIIGKSTPLNAPQPAGGGFGYPIEEVLRTKWTNADINWHSKSPASID